MTENLGCIKVKRTKSKEFESGGQSKEKTHRYCVHIFSSNFSFSTRIGWQDDEGESFASPQQQGQVVHVLLELIGFPTVQKYILA